MLELYYSTLAFLSVKSQRVLRHSKLTKALREALKEKLLYVTRKRIMKDEDMCVLLKEVSWDECLYLGAY